MDEQEIVDQFVEVVTNNVGAISSTRLNTSLVDFFVRVWYYNHTEGTNEQRSLQVYTFAEIFG